ncbi:MAG TPA: hypothetical protein VG389_23445 [Myxococcota bacterium]|nr:hypothetical protein [Myxococcota bacterium]
MAGCEGGPPPEDIGSLASGLSVEEPVGLATRVAATASATDCVNAPGPVITLSGTIVLAGLDGRFVFRNNRRGTQESATTVELRGGGETIAIDDVPVASGVGGNPFIWIQLLDGAGTPLTGETFLGRCTDGLSDVDVEALMPSTASVTVEAVDCAPTTESRISESGSLALGGLKARYVLRDGEDPAAASTSVTTTLDVELLPPGETRAFPDETVASGVGGNPFIWLQLRDSDGAPLTDERLLDRCQALVAGD